VVVGAPRAADRAAALGVLEALHATSPLTPVHIGGPGAPPEHALGDATLAGACDWLVGTLR